MMGASIVTVFDRGTFGWSGAGCGSASSAASASGAIDGDAASDLELM